MIVSYSDQNRHAGFTIRDRPLALERWRQRSTSPSGDATRGWSVTLGTSPILLQAEEVAVNAKKLVHSVSTGTMASVFPDDGQNAGELR